MILSMTGFGAASAEAKSGAARVEVKTVNGRFADVSLRLNGELSALENPVREKITKAIIRGKASVYLAWEPAQESSRPPKLAEGALRGFVEQWRDLARPLGLPPLTAEAILSVSGVFERGAEGPKPDLEEIAALFDQAVDAALAQLAASREAEGARLADDLRARLEVVAKIVADVESRVPETLEAARLRLRKRWDEIAQRAGVEVNDGRLEAEMLTLADKSDVTEELVRLRSHIAAFRQLIDDAADPEPIGRRLDFLLQEFGREANTLGSKARDVSIGPLAIALKHELEKIREQAMNLA